jgi:CubicO group peptidase (beta-lactamase class C family)
MRYLTLIMVATLIMSNSCINSGRKSSQQALKEIDSLFISTYPEDEPGAAVLILKGDSIIFEKGYGLADVPGKIHIDGNTFFNIASVSKQFSAVALLMLTEEGKLSLDDPVKKWFPEFKADFYNKILLKHLLSHSSGIPDSRDRSDRVFVTTATDTLSYSYLKELQKLNFEPGSSYEYMNPTFQLMYTIIERASGMQFDEFMHKRIFVPAGMKESTYFEAEKYIPRMAHGYIYNQDSLKFEQFDYGEESFFATKADGGLYTSAREFVLWEKAIRDNLLISKSSKEEAQSAKTEIPPKPYTSYGYGWFIENRPGFPEKIFHTGDNGGFQIYAGRYPREKLLLLIFSNRNDKDREANVEKVEQILSRANWLN